MKNTFLLFCIFFVSFYSIGQSKFQDGTYVYSKSLHTINNAIFFKIENGTIRHLYYDDGAVTPLKTQIGFEMLKEGSVVNKNNALLTFINSCDDCVWTETQTTNLFYLNHPYVFRGSHKRSVNNNTGEDCFDENNKCFETNSSGYIRLYPDFDLGKDEIRVGGKSSDDISVENIRVTSRTTEITLTIKTAAGNINPPGHESVYSIVTNQGKEYKLLNQYGWGGDLEGGFGSWSSSSSKSRKVILFFEPIGIGEIMAGFHLKEGTCSSGCWNFYDIKYIN